MTCRPKMIDFYPTPTWTVHRLLEEVVLPGGRWIEPCVGSGNIVRAVAEVRPDVTDWTTVDIRSSSGADYITDFTANHGLFKDGEFDVCITNPPYSQVLEFLRVARRISDKVAFLLRLGWLSGAGRADLLRGDQPDVYPLPDRPSFMGKGNDFSDYGWFLWNGDPCPVGIVRVLRPTPLAERRRRRG